MEEMEEYFEFLDGLSESGATNMFAAGPYLVEAFGITKKESFKILKEWMQTFSERHRK